MLERHIITEEVFLDTITDSQTFKTKLGDDIEITKENSGRCLGRRMLGYKHPDAHRY